MPTGLARSQHMSTAFRSVARLVRRGGASPISLAPPLPRRHPHSHRARLAILAQGRRGLSELLTLSGKGDDDGDGGGKRAPLKQGVVSPMREVPPHIPRPPYAASGENPPWDSTPQIHSPENLVKMRAACRLAARVLRDAGKLATPGTTTEEIDIAVHKMIVDAGAYPSPLNYGRFPKSVCTSVNECICHGIPDSRPLCDGDIVNIDVTVYLDGYHGDCSNMFHVGKVSGTAAALCTAVADALAAGIAVCGPGVRYSSIGDAIQRVADSRGFSLNRSFVGHGVGTVFHSSPHILHYRNNEPGVMRVGQTFTIEPMLCEGNSRERLWADGWTAVTTDGKLSAQKEHTLLITEKGVEILTVPE